MRIRRVLAALAISGLAGATFVSTATADAPNQGETDVHLSPAGSDDNEGSAAEPVQTLTGAVSLLAERDTDLATVWIGPGTYYEPAQVNWQNVPQQRVSLRPSAENERPVFDGSQGGEGGVSHYWLNTAGGPSLDIEGLEVRNYRTGGIRMDTDGNVVHDVIFHQIGNQHVADGPGYGALHLLGSSDNEVSDVMFRDLENVDCPGCMHGVYAANGSSDNYVTGSHFERITGDPIRLRHDSHRNVFEHNSFSQAGINRDEDGRWPHRATASFWVFNDQEVCGSQNRVDRNVTDGRDYNGYPGQNMMFGSGAEPGLDRCPRAILGQGNTRMSQVP